MIMPMMGGCAKAPTAPKVESAPPQTVAKVEPVKNDPWPDQLALLGEVLTQVKTPPFLARLARSEEGWIGRLDIPGQAADGLPIDVVQKEEQLVFSLAAVDAHWTLGHDEKGALTCTFKQRGVDLACQVRALTEPELVAELTPKRPQTPSAPYPYEAREVSYDNVAGPVRLAGTLTVPPGEGPFPVAILISGSGLQDRDETVMGHKPFWVLADSLARHGIAALRVDDRGIGGSTMAGAPTSEDFAGDVRAGIAFLKTQKGIDPKRIGLVGHSEGALVGAMVAAKDPQLAFVVLLAPPAVSGADLLVAQSGALLRAAGAPEQAIAEAQSRQREVVDVVLKESDDNEARNKLEVLLEPRDPARAQIPLLLSPWFRFFLKHDVQADLSKIRAPVLAVFGERDVQIPYSLNQEQLAKALKKTKHKHDKVASFPELNHLLQPAGTGLPDEYSTIETTISPEVLELVNSWITGL
jgi:pimeloyl-ACP methyl ester carboxylesterase